MSGPPRQAFAYARVPTEDQADEGLGIAAQLDSTRAAIVERGWALVGEIVDAGVSGAVPFTLLGGSGVAVSGLVARRGG